MSLLLRACVPIAAAAILLAGCSSGPAEDATVTVTTTAPAKSGTTTKSTPKTTTTVSAAGAAPAAASAKATDKEFDQCVFGGGNWTGTALFADGSSGPYPLCEELREDVLRERPFQCPRSDQLVADLNDCVGRKTSAAPTPKREAPAAPAPQTTVATQAPQVETSAAVEEPTSAADSAGGGGGAEDAAATGADE